MCIEPGQVTEKQHTHDDEPGGSRQLVNTLIDRELVDELRLMVFPVVLGRGLRLFGETSHKAALRLVESRPAGECLILVYEPAPKEAQGSA